MWIRIRIPIRTRIQSGSRVLMTKNWRKQIKLKTFSYLLLIKNRKCLCFCPLENGSRLRIRIGIRIQRLHWIQIRIHNTAPPPPSNILRQPEWHWPPSYYPPLLVHILFKLKGAWMGTWGQGRCYNPGYLSGHFSFYSIRNLFMCLGRSFTIWGPP